MSESSILEEIDNGLVDGLTTKTEDPIIVEPQNEPINLDDNPNEPVIVEPKSEVPIQVTQEPIVNDGLDDYNFFGNPNSGSNEPPKDNTKYKITDRLKSILGDDKEEFTEDDIISNFENLKQQVGANKVQELNGIAKTLVDLVQKGATEKDLIKVLSMNTDGLSETQMVEKYYREVKGVNDEDKLEEILMEYESMSALSRSALDDSIKAKLDAHYESKRKELGNMEYIPNEKVAQEIYARASNDYHNDLVAQKAEMYNKHYVPSISKEVEKLSEFRGIKLTNDDKRQIVDLAKTGAYCVLDPKTGDYKIDTAKTVEMISNLVTEKNRFRAIKTTVQIEEATNKANPSVNNVSKGVVKNNDSTTLINDHVDEMYNKS